LRRNAIGDATVLPSTLRWDNIHLNGNGGLIQVTDGKTKAARRMLPMVPAVYAVLKGT